MTIWTLLGINVVLEKAIRNIHELCQELFVCGLKIIWKTVHAVER